MSVQRRLAQRWMEHACAVMPVNRKDWGEAMKAEFAGISDNREALAWAAGCIWASYRERIQPMDVLLKTLVRAAALWLWPLGGMVVATTIALIRPRPELPMDLFLWKAAHGLSTLYGGTFLFLVLCEILIARYWSAPGKIFQKTLVRTTAVWLWPASAVAYRAVRTWVDIEYRFDLGIDQMLGHALRDLLGIFMAAFLTLFLCEWAISRYWPTRQKCPA